MLGRPRPHALQRPDSTGRLPTTTFQPTSAGPADGRCSPTGCSTSSPGAAAPARPSFRALAVDLHAQSRVGTTGRRRRGSPTLSSRSMAGLDGARRHPATAHDLGRFAADARLIEIVQAVRTSNHRGCLPPDHRRSSRRWTPRAPPTARRRASAVATQQNNGLCRRIVANLVPSAGFHACTDPSSPAAANQEPSGATANARTRSFFSEKA
jgi:hypothetical protein